MLTLAADAAPVVANTWELLGAGGFGMILGWYLYFINRYRKGDVQLSDIVTVIGAIGGAAVTALFPANTSLFGAYGIGLAIGFFSYFIVLLLLVRASMMKPEGKGAFDWEWFLDGRCRKPTEDQEDSGQHPLGDSHGTGDAGSTGAHGKRKPAGRGEEV